MNRTRRYPVSMEAAAPGKLVRTRTRPIANGALGALDTLGAVESIPYLARTLLPLPSTFKQQSTYTIQAGDRLDNLSAKLLGDPLLYWMLLEANGTSDPAALCAVPGRQIIVPAAVGQGNNPLDQPVGARRSAASALATNTDDSEESP
jgi:nucleoid-associated protein YgaU